MIEKNINASLIFHVIRFSETLRKAGNTLTQEYGITTQQWFILLLLAKDPNIIYLQENPQDKPMLAKELAEALNVSRANVTNLINILIRKKLLKQVSDGNDKRRKRLTLTTQGVKVVTALETKRHSNNKKLFRKFNAPQKNTIIDFIKVSLQTLSSDISEMPKQR